jgi:hypothetical protein
MGAKTRPSDACIILKNVLLLNHESTGRQGREDAPERNSTMTQPVANPTIASLLGPTSLAAAPPAGSAALDWSDDSAVLDYSRLAYRAELDSARETIVDIMQNGDDARARLAAAKEVNDQAGLPRKSADLADSTMQLPVAVLAGAFALLRGMVQNSQVGNELRSVAPDRASGAAFPGSPSGASPALSHPTALTSFPSGASPSRESFSGSPGVPPSPETISISSSGSSPTPAKRTRSPHAQAKKPPAAPGPKSAAARKAIAGHLLPLVDLPHEPPQFTSRGESPKKPKK